MIMTFALTTGMLLKAASLFLMSIVHEDVAIIAAGLLVLDYAMPRGMALLVLYLGVVAGDVAIYGIGAAVRYFPPARRLIIKQSVQSARFWLKKHMIVSVAACRVLPGILFPTYIACGWFGLSFRTFALTTMTTAAIYVPIALVLAVTLKETVFQSFGLAAWGIMLGFVLLIAFLNARRSRWAMLGSVISTADHLQDKMKHVVHDEARAVTHRGMPMLDGLSRKVAAAEYIPPVFFYVPYVFNWMRLGLRYGSFTLPILANPMIELGGFWGESKSRCMRQIPNEHAAFLANFDAVTKDVVRDGEGLAAGVRDSMTKLGLSFPVVVKPDIGWQGFGVRLLHNDRELVDYASRYPVGGVLIVQEYLPHDGEAGILYYRYPGEEHGRVTSMTLRYFPHVIGDGNSTVRELIQNDSRTRFKMNFHMGENPLHAGQLSRDMDSIPDPGEVVRLSLIGSIRVGGLYRDACRDITPALTERIDSIARSMPEFYYGRFDVRFENMEKLRAGEGFKIIEINGAGSEAIHIWDPGKSLSEVYRTLFKSQSILFDIGQKNRRRGFKPVSLREVYVFSRKQQGLIVQYPPSG